jgi:hypothetical protein
MEQDGLQDAALLQAVMDRKCVEVRRLYDIPYPSSSLSPKEATATCTLWSGNLHLAVEDMCRVSLFEKTLQLKKTTYGLSGVAEFKSLLT